MSPAWRFSAGRIGGSSDAEVAQIGSALLSTRVRSDPAIARRRCRRAAISPGVISGWMFLVGPSARAPRPDLPELRTRRRAPVARGSPAGDLGRGERARRRMADRPSGGIRLILILRAI